MNYGGLVILGASGVGKDPLANEFCNNFAGVKNIKFSELTKGLLAQMFRIPRDYFEDKEWRSGVKLALNGKETDVTPLMLLNALYFGAQESGLHACNIKWALESIGSSFPVFTDIRRVAEFDAIKFLNPIVIKLSKPNVFASITDMEQFKLWEYAQQECKCYNFDVSSKDSFSEIAKFVAKDIPLLQSSEKGILEVYVGAFTTDIRRKPEVGFFSPLYEPLQPLFNRLSEVLEQFDISPSSLSAIVGSLASDIDAHDFPCEMFTGKRMMIFRSYHCDFVPALRRVARLQVYVVDPQMITYAESLFTPEEIIKWITKITP